ncbi:hypothetical protein [Arthrobacter bambusae]|uniref:hypothetical protein n=1 Tax=Arthrobacter bambusae TaxID=1338426 RepID=UPI002788DC2B|nr:hypothetical protein [Arthrobacter bambusae]MDQ0030917.1 hypothetical protein [Arthrobacter bambusae]MDQ0099282.1 hypothetical protein [Arthrobacter bambusae]
MNALLASCLEGELDPVDGLAKLSVAELNFLADALFRLLDVGDPGFGVNYWYGAVLDELAARGEGAARVELPTVEDSVEDSQDDPGLLGEQAV